MPESVACLEVLLAEGSCPITATRGRRPALSSALLPLALGSYGLSAINFFMRAEVLSMQMFLGCKFLKVNLLSLTLIIHVCSSKYQEEYNRLPEISKPGNNPAINILVHFLLIFLSTNMHLKAHI